MRVVPWRYFEDGTVAVHEGGTVAEPWRHMRVVRKNGTVAVPLGGNRWCSTVAVPWRYHVDSTVAVHEEGTLGRQYGGSNVGRYHGGFVAIPAGWYRGGTAAVL